MVEETIFDQNQDLEMETDALITRDGLTTKPGLLSQKHIKLAKLQFLALCWSLFLLGWNDGSTGPLLPRIQAVYDVSTVTFLSSW